MQEADTELVNNFIISNREIYFFAPSPKQVAEYSELCKSLWKGLQYRLTISSRESWRLLKEKHTRISFGIIIFFISVQ